MLYIVLRALNNSLYSSIILTKEHMYPKMMTTEDRNLPYNPEHLTGVIFGVRTSEYDKKNLGIFEKSR